MVAVACVAATTVPEQYSQPGVQAPDRSLPNR
jgi:hypothetical protein